MHKRGFTLIELMISVTIFVIVMVISLGSLLSISSAERKAESLKTVMNNLHFALESMTRTIRTGVNYHCGSGGSITAPKDCDDNINGDIYFAFEAVNGNVNQSNDQIIYRHQTNAAICGQTGTGGCIERSTNGGANFVPITAPEVVISNLKFYVVGAEPNFLTGDTTQPKVVITVNGSVTIGTSPASQFRLQTAVTQRLYDQ